MSDSNKNSGNRRYRPYDPSQSGHRLTHRTGSRSSSSADDDNDDASPGSGRSSQPRMPSPPAVDPMEAINRLLATRDPFTGQPLTVPPSPPPQHTGQQHQQQWLQQQQQTRAPTMGQLPEWQRPSELWGQQPMPLYRATPLKLKQPLSTYTPTASAIQQRPQRRPPPPATYTLMSLVEPQPFVAPEPPEQQSPKQSKRLRLLLSSSSSSSSPTSATLKQASVVAADDDQLDPTIRPQEAQQIQQQLQAVQSVRPQSPETTLRLQAPLSPYSYVRQRYPNWTDVGKQFEEPIPSGQPLPDNEMKVIKKNGIKFRSRLGKGGYGSVYECQLTKPLEDRTTFPTDGLAVKILSLNKYNTSGRTPYAALKEIVNEYRLQSKLKHDNIVSSIDFLNLKDTETEFPIIRQLHFMELCNGTLLDLLGRFGRMGETDAKQWFRHISHGLRYLHSRAICHMDIKCLNILYKGQYPGSAVFKLADYGLAGYRDKITGKYGTTRYMAPEQGDKVKVSTYPCDIWSLGLTLCETLGGVHQEQVVKNQFQMLTNQGQYDVFKTTTSLKIDTYEFVQMVNSMLSITPTDRPTCDQLVHCNWFRLQ
ncbi:uncharacterized protein LOC128954073 [Oppia nitens]|uniref:uncharacterized protein LOC128954073 n=1 Tax=Oppia nitens TaxID=1686743 RepID=UPI0023DB0B70|nr:uncharacterized protein LOC128954073 [Oppia nitens]